MTEYSTLSNIIRSTIDRKSVNGEITTATMLWGVRKGRKSTFDDDD